MEDEDNLWRLTTIKQRPKAIVLGVANPDVAKNCPHWERGNTIRAMFRDCDEEERTDLLEDFLGV